MNRFNSFVRTDYQALPVDYYQMAIAGKEGEYQNDVNNIKSNLDASNAITALPGPDSELKDELIGGINQKIGEIAKQDLTTPQTLLKLSRAVDDPNTISQLSGISQNAANYKSFTQANKDYIKESGNTINTLRGQDQWNDYMKGTKKDFKANFMADYQPRKYVDYNGDIQKVLDKVKADKNTLTYTPGGKWMVKVGNEFRDLKDLMARAGLQLDDPKYQEQLKDNEYYELRTRGGGDVNQGYVNFFKDRMQTLNNTIEEGQKTLDYMLNNNRDGKHDKDIKELRGQIETHKKQLTQTASMTPDQIKAIHHQGFIENAEAMAASPFVMHEHSEEKTADPYTLSGWKANLALNNQMTMYKTKRRDKQMDEKVKDFAENPQPTMTSVKINTPAQSVPGAPGQDNEVIPAGSHNYAVAWFDDKGLYDMNAISRTVSSLLNSGGDTVIDNATGEAVGKKNVDLGSIPGAGGAAGKSKPIANLMEAVQKGNAQIGYVPATKEYMITTAAGTYRVKSDLGMQNSLGDLSRLFVPNDPHKPAEAATEEHPGFATVSLDGYNLRPVFHVNNTMPNGDVQPEVYVPRLDTKSGSIATYNMSHLTRKDFNTLSAIDFSYDAYKDAYKHNGIHVAVEGDLPSKDTGGMEHIKRFVPKAEYEAMIAKGFKPDNGKLSFYLTHDGKMTQIEPQDIGTGGQTLIRSHVQYHSQKNQDLSPLRKKGQGTRTESTKTSSSSSDEVEFKDDETP